MQMKKLRVGVIGVGYLGRFHAEKYAQMDTVELVGVVDVNGDQAKAVSQQIGTNAYSDYRDLFGKVDAVSVVVPTHAHFDVGRAFLERDVDVLIEKPITTTVEEADSLIQFADSRGLILQVGHLERFNPAVVALEDIVKVPRFIESHRLSIFKPRGIDVSVVLDLMIHDIDIILNFVKSDVTDIRAAGTTVITHEVDIANARLEFKNGCVANVTASRISTKNERKIRLFQKDAYISVDFANHEITVVRQSQNGGSGLIPGMELNRLCFAKGDALEAEIRAFVASVISRATPEVSGKVGRDALKIALSIMDQISSTHHRFLNA
jgi:predicted dehydrogenase